MRVLFCEVGKQPIEREIDGSLRSMQELVGGYIQTVNIASDAAVVCNEEGRLNGSSRNRYLIDVCGGILDVLYGDFFIVGMGTDFESLTDVQCDIFFDLYSLPDACSVRI